MSKIGIITLPFDPNFGFELQSFALHHLLSDKGNNEVYIISRGWNQSIKPSMTYKLKRWIYFNIICRRIVKFFNNIPKTEIIRDSISLRNYCLEKGFDKIVFGSDQIWRIENVRGANLDFFGTFLKNDKNIKKYAYAASFGTDQWKGNDDETKEIKGSLNEFEIISVREESGVKLCKDLFDVESFNVLDPTLMLDKDIYNSILCPPKDKRSLVTYLLDTTSDKLNFVKKIAKSKKLHINHLYKKRNYYYNSVEYWLESIRDADFVIVDSFHGMVFSIIFEKQFLVLANKKRGETRFVSLLSKLGLMDRLIYSLEECSLSNYKAIDYNEINKKLKVLRDHSNNIIQDILK